MSDVALILLGCVMIWWTQWYWPRKERRIRTLILERGQSSERFDAVFTSNGFRIASVVITVFSIFCVITGIVLIVTND